MGSHIHFFPGTHTVGLTQVIENPVHCGVTPLMNPVTVHTGLCLHSIVYSIVLFFYPWIKARLF